MNDELKRMTFMGKEFWAQPAAGDVFGKEDAGLTMEELVALRERTAQIIAEGLRAKCGSEPQTPEGLTKALIEVVDELSISNKPVIEVSVDPERLEVLIVSGLDRETVAKIRAELGQSPAPGEAGGEGGIGCGQRKKRSL